MENFDEIKNSWKGNNRHSSQDSLTSASFEKLVNDRVGRENRKTIEYFWSAFVYQNCVYGLSVWLILKNTGDRYLLLSCLTLSALYIPFTIIMMKRFKQINTTSSEGPALSMLGNVEYKYELLLSFFQFKKIYEWIAVPLSAGMISLILFRLYAGGIEGNLIWFAVVWAAILTAFTASIYLENKKRFAQPLFELRTILNDLKNP